MRQFIQFEQFNPFRRPEWRFDRVLQMTAQMPNPGRSTPRDDEYVKKLRAFVLSYKAFDDTGRQKLAYQNPGLFWAYQAYDTRNTLNHRTSTEIESRILAGQTDDEIAKELHTLPDVSKWYEAVFFNVRDRLQNGGWIVNHALMPAYESAIAAGQEDPNQQDEGENNANNANNPHLQQFQRTPLSEPFYDATLKMFGYFGGPIVLNYFLDCGFRRGAVAQGAKDLQEWLDAHYTTRIRHRSAMAAQTFQVTKYDVMELFATHNRIMEIERSGESAESKSNQITFNIAAMLRNMPWAIGDKGRKMVAGTLVEKYDQGAAELRDSELMQLSSGRTPGTIEGIEVLKLPPPRKTDLSDGQEDQQHANAQQGR